MKIQFHRNSSDSTAQTTGEKFASLWTKRNARVTTNPALGIYLTINDAILFFQQSTTDGMEVRYFYLIPPLCSSVRWECQQLILSEINDAAIWLMGAFGCSTYRAQYESHTALFLCLLLWIGLEFTAFLSVLF